MDQRILRLARPERRRAAGRSVAVGLTLLGVMTLSFVMGTGTVRRDPKPRELARNSLDVALERGRDTPEVRKALIELRRTVQRRPLDGKTRIAYAALIASLGQSTDELQVAAFHARRAAELAPVTVPVVRGAVLVLLRTFDRQDGVRLLREMFRYDPEAAARLLAICEPMLFPEQLDEAIDDSPDAWLAWSAQLRDNGRSAEADEWIDRGHRRWPDHLPLRLQAAGDAVQLEDWGRLAAILPPDEALPTEPRWALLRVYRARLRLHRNDVEGATDDLEAALRLNPRSYSVQLRAGDVFSSAGDAARARDVWNRALFRLPADADAYRSNLLRRLARLEEQESNSGAALRLWRSILEIDPHDDEARRRIGALTGSTPS